MPAVTCPIAGTQFLKGARDTLARLPKGARLLLVREPDNRHDPLAVALWIGRQKLGYVPRAENMPVSWAMASKKPIAAVLAHQPDSLGQAAVTITWDEDDAAGKMAAG